MLDAAGGSSSASSASTSAPVACQVPANTDRVNDAVGKIRDLTGDDGFLGTSRNDHMHEVADTFGGLTPVERDAVVAQLSDADLKGLADDIDSGGILGRQGLSADETRDLFNDLAAGLSGPQLARVSNAFGDREDVAAIADSVSRFATTEAKIGYVQAMAGRTTDGLNSDTDVSLGLTTLRASDAEAAAVGKVLGSLSGSSFDRAVSSLSSEQLAAVVKSSADPTTYTSTTMYGASVSGSYQADTLKGLLEAAATSADASVKARVFAEGGKQLGEIAGSNHLLAPNVTADDEAAKVRDGLKSILDSDVTGVVRQLETSDRYGGALSNFVTETLKQGEDGQKAIGGYIAKLQTGEALNENPIARLDAQANGYYRNAQDLGYFAGATQVGVAKVAASNKEQAELIGSIFKSAVGLATGPAGPVAGAAVGLYTDAAVKEAVDALGAGDASLKDTFYELAFPRDPATHQAYEGPAERDYDSALGRVLDANR